MPERVQPDPDHKKFCSFCGQQKQVTSFDRDGDASDGYKSQCKDCRALIRKQKTDQSLDPRLQEIEEQGLGVLETLNRGGSLMPHQAELVESLVRPWGGSDGLSKAIYALYYQTPQNTQLRFKILKLIVDSIALNSRLGTAEQQFDQMEDRDLERAIARIVRENGQDRRVLDAIPQKKQPAAENADGN